MRPGLQPEDHRCDVAGLGGREQKAGDRRIGLRYTAIELITEALAQRFRGAADRARPITTPRPRRSPGICGSSRARLARRADPSGATVPFPVLEAPRRDMCPGGLATADAP